MAATTFRLVARIAVPAWTVAREANSELDQLHRGVFETDAGRFVQTTEPTARQRQLLSAADVPLPKRFEAIEPAITE